MLPPKLFFILFLFYYFLNIIFPTSYSAKDMTDRILPQMVMAIICIYCLFISLINYKQLFKIKVFQPFFCLLLLSLIWVPFSVSGDYSFLKSFISFLKNNMGIVYMFVVYIMLVEYGEKMEKYIFLLFVIQVIFVILNLTNERLMVSKEKIFDSNFGFMLVCCVPMALLYPIKRLRLYILILLVCGCIVSGQRSAALTSILCFPLYVKLLKNNNKRSDFLFIFILLFIVVLPILNLAIDNFIMRHELDVKAGSIGSGRNIFWAIVWKYFWNNDALHILFGNGIDSVSLLLKEKYGMAIGAHNGWLDNLYSFGLFGIFFYAYSLFFLCNESRKMILEKEYANIMLLIFCIFFFKCSTTHGYWDISTNPLACAISYVLYRNSISNCWDNFTQNYGNL